MTRDRDRQRNEPPTGRQMNMAPCPQGFAGVIVYAHAVRMRYAMRYREARIVSRHRLVWPGNVKPDTLTP